MQNTTVAEFANELKMPREALLEQLRRAGIANNAASDTLSAADKQKLLEYLRRAHGDTSDKIKITLARKSASEIKETDAHGSARSIQVEVRKRVLVKRDEGSDVVAEEAAAPALAVVAEEAFYSTLDLPAPEQQEVLDFVAELEAVLRDVSVAVEKSQKTSDEICDLNKELEARGWWGAVKANFSGSTQQELTTQVLALSNSVTVTQEFIRVLLKVQTQKDRVLKSFSDAVTEKILNVQADTQTLNGNQRSAALALLGELQKHMGEQIRQRELVQHHDLCLQGMEQRLDFIGLWQIDRNQRDDESARQMALRFSELEASNSDKEVGYLALREQLLKSESCVAALKDQIGGLEGRLAKLEASQVQARSLATMIARQAPALIALGLAAAAIFRAVGTV